jgi:hypothetical protein
MFISAVNETGDKLSAASTTLLKNLSQNVDDTGN